MPVSVEVDATAGSIIPLLTPRKQPSIPGPPWPQKEARHEVSGAVDLLPCAALQPSEVLTHGYHRPRDSLPFSHPLAWEETGGINSPPTPFSCCLAPFFGGLWNSCPPGCAVAWPEQPRGAAAGRSWAVLTSCLRGIEPLLAQGAAQSPSLETHQCRKPGQKKGAASTQKGKVICPSRRLEQNLEQSFFACQCNPLTFSNNAATLS